jgi:hypothetical protein
MPMPAPQSSPCDPCGQPCADYIVDGLKPAMMSFTRVENVLLALIAGGVIGFFVGRKS